MRIWRYVDQIARSGSIRRAAELLNVTPSALQRRIGDVEADLGAALFERSSDGMRLTEAGELFVTWVRAQDAELERTRSIIDGLAGLRGGHVRLSCSQALAASFVPQQIAAFQSRHPLVQFDCQVHDHEAAIRALMAYEADLALILRPARRPELQPLSTLGQRLVVLMAENHPLAAQPMLRLRDCLPYPVALPDRGFGTRQLLEACLTSGTRWNVVLQTNSFELLRHYVRNGQALSFQFEIGIPPEDDRRGLAVRPVDDRDEAHAPLVLGQLRGRVLPVAAAVFAEQMARDLDMLRRPGLE